MSHDSVTRRSRGDGEAAEDTGGRSLAVAAVVAAVLVGPVGIALGIVVLARRGRSGRAARRLAIAAIVLGVVQTVVVGILLAGRADRAEPTAGTTPIVVVDGSGETAEPDASPTPHGPLGEELTETDGPLQTHSGSFVSDGLTPAQDLLDAGAVEAYGGTFTNGRDDLSFVASEWSSAEEAEEAAAEQAATADPGELVKTAPAGSPVHGQYWYYERPDLATILWTNGTFLFQVSGPPYQVQDFYLAYPL